MSVEFATFEDMLKAVKGLRAMPIAVINADEQHVLEGACEAAEAGYVDPILIGDENSIRNILKTITCTKQFRIIHAPLEDAMAEKGVELFEKG
jgi:phosphotransacetylase